MGCCWLCEEEIGEVGVCFALVLLHLFEDVLDDAGQVPNEPALIASTEECAVSALSHVGTPEAQSAT